ncbi:hypothetical protein HDA32_001862 [Spinactinospora alkalitolerans]|uniref:EcsC family protein n=1 Tax=Spinactinospora alkalitolerans TaxID=687207 RepID=A0A852TV41_9ACTN|nr:hypothetical protein [Spinactinospora alkalitolerans]NYE46742.1 hypothetical protein [Spinactinospora alkalitolerans]
MSGSTPGIDGHDERGRAGTADLVPVGDSEVGDLVQRLVADDGTDKERRVRLLGRLSKALAGSARAAGTKGVAGGRWLTDLFANEIAPRVPVRDRETLVAHHGGLEGEELADALVRNATNATTAVGAAGGALAAVQFTAPPLLLTAPAQIVAETVVVAAIEVKLIGELHEVYGVPARGGPLQRTSGYLVSWAKKRGIDPLQAAESVTVALGAAAKTALRNRLMRLLGRHLTTLGPYLTGAVAGGALNRAGTRTLARSVRADLRSTALPGGSTADAAGAVGGSPAGGGRALPEGGERRR